MEATMNQQENESPSAYDQATSRVVRVNDQIRVARLLGLQGYTNRGVEGLEVDPTYLYNAIATFVASKHFNERNGTILPGLPDMLNGCDLYWYYEYRDDHQDNLEAAKQLIMAVDQWNRRHNSSKNGTDNMYVLDTVTVAPTQEENGQQQSLLSLAALQEATQSLDPMAVYGAYWSRISKTNLAITGAFEIPYITAVSTSAELAGSPLFARTSPSSDGDARAAMLYYKHLGISHIAVLFIRDSWGINYHSSLVKYSREFDVTSIASFPYDVETVERTIARLQMSGYRHIFGIMNNWREVLQIAYEYEIVGKPGYVWIAAEEGKWASLSFNLNANSDMYLAKALHGIGTLNIKAEPVPAFNQAMNEFASNTALQKEFISINVKQDIFNNFTFPNYVPNGFSEAAYDAIMALGIATCNASNRISDSFSGPEIYDALRNTDFMGVSGHIQFDAKTGSRLPQNVRYAIEYVVISEERSDQEYIRFDSNIVAIIQGNNLTSYHPFIYNDNTFVTPEPLPPVSGVELNLLPGWAQAFGYVLACLVIIASMTSFVWTIRNRKIYVLCASQPFFLCQLCMGVCIMAVAIFPFSIPLSSPIHSSPELIEDKFQDSDMLSTRGLDAACMANLWLLAIGFSIAFSALASKTWRLNQLINAAANMRRSTVSVHDVMLPLYVSLAVNCGLMLGITFVSPLRYERVPVANYDSFGRSLESFGSCQPENDKIKYLGGAFLVANFLGILVVTWEAYKGRNAPTDFSDAYWLSIAMLSLLETLIIGAPILIVASDSPTTYFLVGSSLLAIACFTILLLLFLPKYLGRRRSQGARAVASQFRRTNDVKAGSRTVPMDQPSANPSERARPSTNQSENDTPQAFLTGSTSESAGPSTSQMVDATGRMNITRHATCPHQVTGICKKCKNAENHRSKSRHKAADDAK